jgi:hypothetical protein
VTLKIAPIGSGILGLVPNPDLSLIGHVINALIGFSIEFAKPAGILLSRSLCIPKK